MSDGRCCSFCKRVLPDNQRVIIHIKWPRELISPNGDKMHDHAFCDYVHLRKWLDNHAYTEGWAWQMERDDT